MTRHRQNPCILWTPLILSMVWLLSLAACNERLPSRMEQIWEAGRIVMITDGNAHSYHPNRKPPSGFEYELAKTFADHLGVELKVITPGWGQMVIALNDGRGDFVAAGLAQSPFWNEYVDFSDVYMETALHALVHMDNSALQVVDDLAGKEVHVRSGTSGHQRLLEMRDSGIDIRIVPHENATADELIRRVAEKKIEIAIADSHVAFLNRRYYPAIRKPLTVSDPHRLRWAVRKGDRELTEIINSFFERIIRNGKLAQIHDRYYSGIGQVDYFDLKKFHDRIASRLPAYTPVIMREARRHDFDWRLIAALIYQESHFDPGAVSDTGVRGLMQLTRETAGDLGVEDRCNPHESIGGGIKYLRWLYGLFDDIPGVDRMLFALASYNIGYGHVRDAQGIARDKGFDHSRWLALRKTLPLLRQSDYNRQTIHGYARGDEPVRYVDRILAYYDILRWKAASRN